MEEQIITRLLSEGAAGLLSAICLCAVVILWRQIVANDKLRANEINEREKRMEERMIMYQSEQKEIFTRYSELARDVAEVTARATAAVENNTQVLQNWGGRIERLSERIDRLEESK